MVAYTAVSREAWATLPESSSRPLPATLAQTRTRMGPFFAEPCTVVLREAWATLPESSSRPLPATLAQSRNLAHASLKTAVRAQCPRSPLPPTPLRISAKIWPLPGKC